MVGGLPSCLCLCVVSAEALNIDGLQWAVGESALKWVIYSTAVGKAALCCC